MNYITVTATATEDAKIIKGSGTAQAFSCHVEVPSPNGKEDAYNTTTKLRIEIWGPNYANTSNFTQALVQWGYVGSSTTNYQWISGQTAGVFMNTAAINQFTLNENTGNNFMQHSTFTLYGINGAA